MAVFSSTGLAVGGRIKPDVTAPGFFISSANSNAAGDCPITEMAGTSMATPITAGNVALIRQYLREGFWPEGERGNDLGGNNFDGSIIPSGALMKAMTISAAQVMPGVFPQPPDGAGQALGGYPNQYSGYGRVQLNQVLFAKENGRTAGGRLFLIDGETVATGEEKVYTIPTRGDDEGFGTEFKVVLVWTDPPAEPISQNPLVNNLDLEVDGQNGNSDGGGGAPDTVNNVEAVRIANTNSETVEVKVKGTSVVEGGPQKFALVVTGPLQLTSPPPAPRQSPPPAPPSGPFDPSALGDKVALGISIPLLLVALGSAFGFVYKRVSNKGGGAIDSKGGLPPGWKMQVDPASGQPFYVNDATQERTWEKPTSGDSDLPPGWTAQAVYMQCTCMPRGRRPHTCRPAGPHTCRPAGPHTCRPAGPRRRTAHTLCMLHARVCMCMCMCMCMTSSR